MQTVDEIHAIFKSEHVTAVPLPDNKWEVRTAHGIVTVDGSHPELGLTGPAVTEREQLDELYGDKALTIWLDYNDIAYYDSVVIQGKRYHVEGNCPVPIEDCEICQDLYRQWYEQEQLEEEYRRAAGF